MTYRHAARFYDLFGSKDDLQFYQSLALQHGKRALELGVGTARVALSLARVEVTVLGIDTSDSMLEVARKKLAKEPETIRKRVELKKADMRDFQLEQSFPFVYIPASTFDHNISPEDQRKTLDCISNHLVKGGVLAFDLEQAGEDRPDRSWWVDRASRGGKTIVRSIFTRKQTTRNSLCLDIFYDVYVEGKLAERYHEYGEVAILREDGIISLLEAVGLKNVQVYGDFDRSIYRKSSPRMVFVAEKT